MRFGLWSLAPKDGRPAWGARAIIERNAQFNPNARYTKRGTLRKKQPSENVLLPHRISLLPDRQTIEGDFDGALRAQLNAGPLEAALLTARQHLRDGVMFTNRAGLLALFEDSSLIIFGNTNASCGYLYLIAYPKRQSQSPSQSQSEQVPMQR